MTFGDYQYEDLRIHYTLYAASIDRKEGDVAFHLQNVNYELRILCTLKYFLLQKQYEMTRNNVYHECMMEFVDLGV